MRPLNPALLLSALVLLSAVGCKSTYERYTYRPQPASTEIDLPNPEEGALSVLVSILGFSETEDGHAVVETRFWMGNDTGESVELIREEMKLFTADLIPMHPMEVVPREAAPVPAGEDAVVNARFKFPGDLSPGDVDIARFNLQWTVRVGSRIFRRDTTFDRSLREEHKYYDPYYYHPYPMHVGWYHYW